MNQDTSQPISIPSNEPIHSAMDKIGNGIAMARDRWLEAVLKELVPERIIKLVHGGDRERAKAAAWLGEHGFEVHKSEQETILLINSEPVSYFRVELKAGQLVVNAKKVKVMPKLVDKD